jgi:hypothetical protein
VETRFLYFKIDPKNIVMLKSVLEGHEGFLVLRTHDPKEGIIQLLVSPDFETEVRDLLASLSETIWMEPVPPPDDLPPPFAPRNEDE